MGAGTCIAIVVALWLLLNVAFLAIRLRAGQRRGGHR